MVQDVPDLILPMTGRAAPALAGLEVRHPAEMAPGLDQVEVENHSKAPCDTLRTAEVVVWFVDASSSERLASPNWVFREQAEREMRTHRQCIATSGYRALG